MLTVCTMKLEVLSNCRLFKKLSLYAKDDYMPTTDDLMLCRNMDRICYVDEHTFSKPPVCRELASTPCDFTSYLALDHVLHILRYLLVKDVLNLAKVNKKLHQSKVVSKNSLIFQVMQNDSVWNVMSVKYFRVYVLTGIPSWKELFKRKYTRSRGPIMELQVPYNYERLLDVSLMKTRKEKWLHCFSELHRLIYVVDVLSFEFNAEEVMEDFDYWLQNEWFTSVEKMIFFNKVDLLREYLKRIGKEDEYDERIGEFSELRDYLRF